MPYSYEDTVVGCMYIWVTYMCTSTQNLYTNVHVHPLLQYCPYCFLWCIYCTTCTHSNNGTEIGGQSAHNTISPCEAFWLILVSRGWRTVIISLQIWSNTRLLMVSLTQALGVTGGSPLERLSLKPRWLSDSSTLGTSDEWWTWKLCYEIDLHVHTCNRRQSIPPPHHQLQRPPLSSDPQLEIEGRRRENTSSLHSYTRFLVSSWIIIVCAYLAYLEVASVLSFGQQQPTCKMKRYRYFVLHWSPSIWTVLVSALVLTWLTR